MLYPPWRIDILSIIYMRIGDLRMFIDFVRLWVGCLSLIGINQSGIVMWCIIPLAPMAPSCIAGVSL